MNESENLKKLHGAVAKMLGDFDKRLIEIGGPPKPIVSVKPAVVGKELCFFCDEAGCFVCK